MPGLSGQPPGSGAWRSGREDTARSARQREPQPKPKPRTGTTAPEETHVDSEPVELPPPPPPKRTGRPPAPDTADDAACREVGLLFAHLPTPRADGMVASGDAARFVADANRCAETLIARIVLDPAMVPELQSPLAAQLREVQSELGWLRQEVEATRAVPRTLLDRVAGALLRITISTVLGGLVGGPAMAYVLNEPLVAAAVEGAIGGLVGGIASEAGAAATGIVDGDR